MPASEPPTAPEPKDRPQKVEKLRSGSESSPLARLGRIGRTGYDEGSEMDTSKAPTPATTSPENNMAACTAQTVHTPERSAFQSSLRPTPEQISINDISIDGAKAGSRDKDELGVDRGIPGHRKASDKELESQDLPGNKKEQEKDDTEKRGSFEREKGGWPAPQQSQKSHGTTPAECRNRSNQFTLPKTTWRVIVKILYRIALCKC